MQILEREVRLHDARGFDTSPQDVLLSWDVGGLGYSVQIVQVAERERSRARGGEGGQKKKKNNSGGDKEEEGAEGKTRGSLR